MNSEKFLEVLNNDQRSKNMLDRFNEAAKHKGLAGDEYLKARDTIIMMCIASNRELIHQMADEIWDNVNK